MTDYRGPGHVTGVFHDPDDDREHENLRHEHEESPNASEERVCHKILEQGARQQGHEPIRPPGESRLNSVHGRGCPGEDRLEKHGHECEEGEPPEQRMEEESIEARLPT